MNEKTQDRYDDTQRWLESPADALGYSIAANIILTFVVIALLISQ